MNVYVYRDSTGSLRIDVETDGVDETQDAWPNGVPKLRMSINCSPAEQVNVEGEWEVGDGYFQISPLEQLADAAE